MPYLSEKKKLNNYDRRRKLTENQKEEIRKKYKTGLYSQRGLAKEYGVSRTLIQIIVDKQRAEKVKQRIKDHWRDYYDKDEHNKAMKNTRRYKQKLYLEGKI